MEKLHNDNGAKDLGSWEPWCYAPIAGGIAVAANGNGVDSGNDILRYMVITDGQRITALAPWRLSKEVFIIDKELEGMLYDQIQDDLDIPAEILLQLPFPCIYVQADDLTLGDHKYHGFFAHLENDIDTNDRELRLLFLSANGTETMGFPIHIDEKNLEDNMQRVFSIMKHNTEGTFLQDATRQFLDEWDDYSEQIILLRKALQIVLYICSTNADISANEEQKNMVRRTKTTVIRDRYAEIRKWDTGIRVGNAVRRYRAKQQPGEQKKKPGENATHASPRPHIRRAHWHHYWTGKRDDQENRKLILKWNPPAYVGIEKDLEPELPVVLHIVQN